AAGTSKDCILCLSCLKKCKHQSVRVDVRFPWYEFLVKEKWNVTEGYFAVILTALVLAVKLPSTRLFSQWMDQQVWIDRTLLDVLLSLSTGALFILAVVVASGFFSGESWKKNFAISGFTYIFLAFAGFLNIYLHEFVYSGHHLLPWIVEMVGLQSLVPAEWITPNLGTLKAIIPLITLLGLTTSILLFSVLSKKNSMPLMVSRAQQGIMLVTALVFLLIL
ncbi:MAG: hypothetical protein L7F78_25990, partial [Syntrophales bacterium LBB04]|nr:hypothetical protein [Syntrophales bacterium LBB04]